MRSQTQKTFLVGFILSVATCGLIGIICLLQGQIGSLEGHILGSTALFGAASILGLASAIVWERRYWHPIGPLGVVLTVIALGTTLIFIWGEYLGASWIPRHNRDFVRAAGTFWILAVAFPHIGLTRLARLHRSFNWVRRWTIMTIIALAGLLIYLFVIEPRYAEDIIGRIVGILAIGDVCGTLAIAVLHRVSAIRAREAVRTVDLRLSLTCPRCSTTQELSVGRQRCATCGLRITIDIEEEQCRNCGYPLYKLQSAACPECGTPIARPSPA